MTCNNKLKPNTKLQQIEDQSCKKNNQKTQQNRTALKRTQNLRPPAQDQDQDSVKSQSNVNSSDKCQEAREHIWTDDLKKTQEKARLDAHQGLIRKWDICRNNDSRAENQEAIGEVIKK